MNVTPRRFTTALATLFAGLTASTTLAAPQQFWTENIELDALTEDVLERYGESVCVDGPWAVVGWQREDHSGLINPGAVAVWLYTGSWSFSRYLTASDAAEQDWFGSAVALDRPTLVVGARSDDSGEGAAYVFDYVGGATQWVESAKLEANNEDWNDFLGAAVDVDDSTDTIVVGAPGDSNNVGIQAGGVYVFVRSGSTWTQQAKLRATGIGADYDFLGTSVAIEDDVVVAGAPGYGTDGAVFAWTRLGTSWSLPTLLTPPTAGGSYGTDVAFDGDTVIAGGVGKAPTWRLLSHGGWVTGPTLDPTPDDATWISVGLHGDRAVLGNAAGDEVTGFQTGEAYVYVRSGQSWTLQQELAASDAATGDQFGHAVDVFDGLCVVSAPVGDSATTADCGTVYAHVFADPHPGGCDGTDGALAACPCGNAGSIDTGCDNAQGTGGVRAEFVAIDPDGSGTGRLVGTGFPPSGTPTAIVVRGNNTSAPTPLFDGVRCTGLVGFTRMAATTAVAGQSIHDLTHGAGPGTYFYQIWYRNTPGTYCTGAASNLSNGDVAEW